MELGKQLVWLPCRHHVFERVLADVYHSLMGPSTGPEVVIFKNFASIWQEIDNTKYNDYTHWKESRSALSEDAASLINFAEAHIQDGQPRDDYLELLELSIIFLGGSPDRGVRFRCPGPIHSARWMAKAIYCLKIVLFRKQLLQKKTITGKQAKDLLQMAVFVVKVYIKSWYTASHAIQAPMNDLQLLKVLVEYEKINKSVARAAQNRLSSHLWYLSEVNVAFSLFDGRVSNEEKEAAVSNMKNCDGSDDLERKRFIQIRDVPSMTIADLFTKRTNTFLDIVGIEKDFLKEPVHQWERSADFKEARDVIGCLMVVNDHAERSVKLMSDFNRSVTKNEKSFQELLLTVQDHRKTLPDVKKKSLCSKYDKKKP